MAEDENDPEDEGLGRDPDSKIPEAKGYKGLGRNPDSKIKQAKGYKGLGRNPDSNIPQADGVGGLDEDPNKEIEEAPAENNPGGDILIQAPFGGKGPDFEIHEPDPVQENRYYEHFKPFPFCLKRSGSGGVVYYGSLVQWINKIGPTHNENDQVGVCSPTIVCPKNFVEDPQPDMCGTQLRMATLDWTGEVHLQWWTDYAGVVDADSVELVKKSELLTARCLPHESGGIFSVKIGTIPENDSDPAKNDISSDVYFYGAFIGGGSSTSSSSGSGVSGGSSGSSKSAIVPVSFNDDGYAALFSLEAPEVRFEETVEVYVRKGISVIPIDQKFIEVCEPGTLKVCSICPSIATIIGGRVEGMQVVVDSQADCTAVIRVTGIRKGFKNVRFPSRSEDQFKANEQFLKSAQYNV